MAELLRTHPLEAWRADFERLPDTVGVTVEPFVAMVDVRLGTVGAEASAALGVDLPTAPNTWVPAGTGRAVWLGPDEWLLSSTTEAPRNSRPGSAPPSSAWAGPRRTSPPSGSASC